MAPAIESRPRNDESLPAGPPAPLDVTERLAMAEEWQARTRETYRGGVLPPIIYSFTPPFLFDCRLNSTRRMGIGDQLCLLSAIQAVAWRVGEDNVLIWYDADYPGSADVFGMTGLPVSSRGVSGEYPQGYTVIPCRGHIMESPIRASAPCLYGELKGSPIAQILWGWGWHNLIGGHSIRLGLWPDRGATNRAKGVAAQYAPYVTCTPLEVSRHNNNCGVDAWRSLLMRVDPSNTILFGCGPGDKGQLSAMIAAMNLPHKGAVIVEPLPVWKAIIDMAWENYTGNSCGMWLSFASRTRTYLLQHDDPKHTHNMMWNYKESWGCRNVEIINA